MTSAGHASFHVVDRRPGAVTVAVSGEIDAASAPPFRSYLDECLSEGATEITLDLTELTFIDSTGLTVLVGVINQLRREDGRLIICNPPAIAVQVLRVSGLTSSLEIVAKDPGETPDQSTDNA
jgi:anti-sigma B factor antagonist